VRSRFRGSTFKGSKLAHSSWLIVRKLEGLKALKLPGFLASWHPSFKPMTYELSAMSYLPKPGLQLEGWSK
jgi:hypothetical protein